MLSIEIYRHIRLLKCNSNCHNVVFFQHSRKVLHLGESASHSWRLTWVRLGDPNHPFPDSGEPAVRIGVVRCGPSPCSSWESCPLQITTYNSRWMNIVVRLWFGCVAFVTATVTAQAQTYYYYPTSVHFRSQRHHGHDLRPDLLLQKGVVRKSVVWYAVFSRSIIRLRIRLSITRRLTTPQYYQTAHQPDCSAGLIPSLSNRCPDTPSDAQVIPTSYTTYDAARRLPRRQRRARTLAIPTASRAGSMPPGPLTACQRSVTTRTCRTGRPRTTTIKPHAAWATS